MIKSKPLNVFVSYSHRDKKHLLKLKAHLAGLELEGAIRCWWDGLIEPGVLWERSLISAIESADIVVLLLTADFINSNYCVETELKSARERERRGQIDIVPILVDDFDLGSHWIGKLQMISIDGKSLVASRSGARGWTSVVTQLRRKFDSFRGHRPVLQALNEVEEIVHSAEHSPNIGSADSIHDSPLFGGGVLSVGSFWKSANLIDEGAIVRVKGTLSRFAPMLMGHPNEKRILHREFRRAIEMNRGFGERKRLTISACMSISAGQMVHWEKRAQNKKRLLGLYESIVRNSIPIFIRQDYYSKFVESMMFDSKGAGCFEAVISGRVIELDNTYVRRFLHRQGLDKILPSFVMENLGRGALALDVGDIGTGVEFIDYDSPYLDGDVWVAVEDVNSAERFVTGFVDLTNSSQRDEELLRIKSEIGGARIIAIYDRLPALSELIDGN